MATIMYEACRRARTPASGGAWSEVQGHGDVQCADRGARVLKKQDPALTKHDLSSPARAVPRRRAARRTDRHPGSPGRSTSPIIDNYWQTETGWPILAICNGVEQKPTKFGSPACRWLRRAPQAATRTPARRHQADQKGVGRGPAAAGLPADTVWGDDARFVKTYFDHPGRTMYNTFDWAASRRRRLLLHPRPHRRRHQRRRPSPRHARDRGEISSHRPSPRWRWWRRRPAEGPGGDGLRGAEGYEPRRRSGRTPRWKAK